MKTLRGQTTLEALLLFSVALIVIIFFSSLFFDQMLIFNYNSQSELAKKSLKILSTEANNVYLLGDGSVKEIFIQLPLEMDLDSSKIENNYLMIFLNGESIFEFLNFNVDGNFNSFSSRFSLKNINGVVNISN
jgi:hypothetical protein